VYALGVHYVHVRAGFDCGGTLDVLGCFGGVHLLYFRVHFSYFRVQLLYFRVHFSYFRVQYQDLKRVLCIYQPFSGTAMYASGYTLKWTTCIN
jgi:hypothetical protein